MLAGDTRKFPVESALIEPPDKHSHKRRLTTSEQCTMR
jgi:hypothetical protein